VGASANQDDRYRGITQIFAADFPHDVFRIVAVNKIVVVERAKGLGREHFFDRVPLADEAVNFLPVGMKRGNENIPLYRRRRRWHQSIGCLERLAHTSSLLRDIRRRENQAGGKSSAAPTDRGITKRSTFRIDPASFNVKHATLAFMQVGFTPRQVTRLTGVPYSTLNLWAKKGLVRPSIALGQGSGSERIYSFSDLIALKVAFELRKAGVTTRSIEKVVQFVRENEGLEKPLSEARLLVSGRDVLVVRNGQQLVSALSKPGQSCLSFIVDLPRTVGELVHATESANAFGLAVLSDSDGSVRRKQPASVHRISRTRQRN
jgi:DNA-binding transcriptional MerR regulator